VGAGGREAARIRMGKSLLRASGIPRMKKM